VAYFIVQFVQVLFQVLILAIVGRALISWFPINPDNPLIRILDDITEPILAPMRRVVPRLGMFDITPIVAIFVLMILENILVSGLGAY
jgi:YggT family protein